MSNPTDPIKPSSRREVTLFEQAYQLGADDAYAAMRIQFDRDVRRTKHPIREAFHRLVSLLRGHRVASHRVDKRG